MDIERFKENYVNCITKEQVEMRILFSIYSWRKQFIARIE